MFLIRLRDTLTRLPLRFPDRIPTEDHDKTLKDHFFYGICSDLQNSIHHLYDDETVTFSQLLVKVCQNEEEEMTSKLVNKGLVMESTLEERVDRLIAKSNQEPPPNQRGNPNSHSFDRVPYTRNQRSERNPNLNFQESQNDIHQNLRDPEPSVAGPFDEEFLDYINKVHETIKFTAEYSMTEVAFLDTLVYKLNRNLTTNVYHKKTDDKMYLHYSSAHPRSQKDAIPYSLFVRCKRICTETRHFFMEVQDITQKLAHRGYPHELIVKSFLKANQQNRDNLLLMNDEKLTTDKKIRLITT